MTRPQVKGAPALAAALIVAAAVVGMTVASVAMASAGPGEVIWGELSQRAPSGDDGYTALAVSPSGAVCAAGVTTSSGGGASDVLVRAYSASGSVLWRRVWTWPGRSDDAAAAVARDRRGGYVVAGSSGTNWLLLKYSAGGYLQWVRRGHGSFGRASFAAVAVDGSGSVYAAGVAAPAGSDARLLLSKYSSTGALRWRRTVASASGDASAVAVVLGGGDVYVAGRAATGAGSSAALTVKYSALGVRRWEKRYAAAAADAARAAGLVWAGGPAICGWGGPAGDPEHGFVVRYDAGGETQWTGTAAVPGASGERFTALAAGDAGRVCVAGAAATVSGDAALTACFQAGAQLWAQTGTGAPASAVCGTGDGFACASGTDVFAVRRLTPAGETSWTRSLSPPGYGDFRPEALQAAGDAYLYAVGSAAVDGGGRASVVVRYRP